MSLSSNKHRFRDSAAICLSTLALLTFSVSAHADLVSNGGFESTTNGAGQMGYNTNATDWTTNGYNFIFTPGSADSTGANGQFGDAQLWGPGNGSNNGLPATSPVGGNYVGADGAFGVGAISQTITGLTAGDSYVVGFWCAGAQQFGFTGLNTEQWQVSFGSETQDTAVYSNSSQGFSGWMHQTFTFTADSTSDALSFLAVGTPISPNVPPFSLLDGVSVNLAPEPEYLIPSLGFLVLLFGLRFLKSKKLIKI